MEWEAFFSQNFEHFALPILSSIIAFLAKGTYEKERRKHFWQYLDIGFDLTVAALVAIIAFTLSLARRYNFSVQGIPSNFSPEELLIFVGIIFGVFMAMIGAGFFVRNFGWNEDGSSLRARGVVVPFLVGWISLSATAYIIRVASV